MFDFLLDPRIIFFLLIVLSAVSYFVVSILLEMDMVKENIFNLNRQVNIITRQTSDTEVSKHVSFDSDYDGDISEEVSVSSISEIELPEPAVMSKEE